MQQNLTIAAIMIVGALALMYYRANTTQSTMNAYNEAMIAATQAGQSVVEEIKVKAFDEHTAAAACASAAALTPPWQLGPDWGEWTAAQFDDVDDYNGYSRDEGNARLGTVHVSVAVEYVNRDAPDLAVGYSTFAKKVTVGVTNARLVPPGREDSNPDTVKLFYIAAY